MGVHTKKQFVGTAAFQENTTVQQEIYVPQRYVWNIYLRLTACLTVVANSGTAIARNPGTLCDIRVMLNNSRILAAGHWYSFAVERSLLNTVLPTEVAAAAGAAAYQIESMIRIPVMCPWARMPWETILDMRQEQRVDLFVNWGDDNDLVAEGAGGQSFTTAPQVDIVIETSEDAPVGASNGYYVQRELETTGLGTDANADLQIELPVGPDHNYVAMCVSAMDVVANSLRTLVDPPVNSLQLEFRGPGGHQIPIDSLDGPQIQGVFKLGHRHPDAETVGVYPIALMGGAGGGTIGQAVQTGDASDLRLHIDHAAFDTDGLFLTCYDVYQPRV